MILNLFKWFIDSMKAIYNSRILPEEEIELQIRNRAFCYGDGLFETIVTGPDRINLLHLHIARLNQACTVLDLKIPFDKPTLERQIEALKIANNLAEQLRTRVQVWRKEGGLYEPTENECSYLISIAQSEIPFYKKLNSLSVSRKAKVSWHALSFAKTMSALPYVLAGIERKQSPHDDLVITDGVGNMAECVISNIFWVINDQIFTPHLDSGCVNGTMRQYLISQFTSTGIAVNEVLQPIESLYEADHIFISNASGIQWVAHFEDKASFTDPKGLLERAAILPLHP